MIINRIHENQNLLSLVSFLVGLRTYQHPGTMHLTRCTFRCFLPSFGVAFTNIRKISMRRSWNVDISQFPFHVRHYSPFRALASLKACLHSSLCSALLHHPLTPNSCNVSLWTTSAHLVLGLPTDLVLWKVHISQFSVWIIGPNSMKSTGHVERMGNFIIAKSEGAKSLRCPRFRLEDNINMNLKKTRVNDSGVLGCYGELQFHFISDVSKGRTAWNNCWALEVAAGTLLRKVGNQ